MPFECNLTVTGIRPEQSARAFIQSYQETSNPKYYKKHQKHLEEYFSNKLQKNIQQNQIQDKNLDKTFSIDFKSDGIYFSSTSKKALKYEFGSGKIPPKRYIQPAIIDTANELSQIMITDAIDSYNRYSKIL